MLRSVFNVKHGRLAVAFEGGHVAEVGDPDRCVAVKKCGGTHLTLKDHVLSGRGQSRYGSMAAVRRSRLYPVLSCCATASAVCTDRIPSRCLIFVLCVASERESPPILHGALAVNILTSVHTWYHAYEMIDKTLQQYQVRYEVLRSTSYDTAVAVLLLAGPRNTHRAQRRLTAAS